MRTAKQGGTPMRVTRKARCQTPRTIDIKQVLADLDAPDECIRARAVRNLCPCRVGYAIYEQYMPEVKRLQKDKSLLVRKAALHVEEDAFRLEQKIHPLPEESK
jgi:vesicle coat complex subunit